MTRWRRPTRRDRGGGGVEMAIILPLLLVCVLATAHMSMYVLARQAAMSLAQVAVEGQRGWQHAPGAGERRAERFAAQLPRVLRDAEITLTCDGEPLVGRCDGERVAATVTGASVSVFPWLRHTVSRTATGAVERVTP